MGRNATHNHHFKHRPKQSRTIVIKTKAKKKSNKSSGSSTIRQFFAPKSKAKMQVNHAFSQTKVATKTRSTQTSTSQGGLDASYIRISGRRLPSRVKTIGRWKYSQNLSAITVGNAGQQQPSSVLAVGCLEQHLSSTGASYLWNQSDVAYKYLNPSLATAGSVVYSSVVTPKNDAYCVLGHTFESEISNFEGVDTFVDYYIFRCKQATGTDPDNSWIDAITADAMGATVMTFPTPGGAVAGALGTQQKNNPGAVPHENKAFNKFWGVAAFKRLKLAGGATHRVTVRINDQRYVYVPTIQKQFDTGIRHVPGTFVVYTIARGTVIEDITAGAGNAKCTYAQTRVGHICVSKSHFCGVKDASARWNTTLAYSTVPVGAAAANQKFMDVEDIVQTVAGSVLPS